MSIAEQILNTYPELTDAAFKVPEGVIRIVDDSDGYGAYIAKWEYSKPIPEGLTLGKPLA